MSFLSRTCAPLRRTLTLSAPCTTTSIRHKSSSAKLAPESTTTSNSRAPELFDQTIVLSNGATFTLRTPSPRPQIRLTRDTRNHPLWNPDMSRGMSSDDSGQLTRFTKKFGDMDGFGDMVDFADGGDVDRKALTAKQIAQASPQSGKGKKKK
ncbi:hypothetical protein BGW38_005344 [Lunasporangiospora selenospora]|uniref:Ribosomal protein bL31m N-terminal domain-containing protein n=1 Tax=Lunasporangiospora selenospora TaxID=979761 RepID=A0A9P6KHF5_9FUNG|nr:hypothetical protein BGW38_005344 [Lunasporangiospora selenospora]